MAHTRETSGSFEGRDQHEEIIQAGTSGHHEGGHGMASWWLLWWWSGGCLEADTLRDSLHSDLE